MNAGAQTVAEPPWWRPVLADEAQVWLYIGKTVVALYLAAWLAMRLEMPSPSTAMITVLIVMNRQSGLVLAKAFYRGIGTVVGCVAGVALVALFPQQPVLLLAAMALWAGTMAAGALLNRNMRAYSFVLAGYTVAMIVLPSVNHPVDVFDTAVWRLAEVALGLVVASCVFDVAWPVRLRGPLLGMARGNANELLAAIARSAPTPADASNAVRALGARAVAYEDLRSTAFFDDPSLRASDGALRQLNQRYLGVLSAWQALPLSLRGEQPAPPLHQRLDALATLLTGADAGSPGLVAQLEEWAATSSKVLAAAIVPWPQRHALERLGDALVAYLRLFQQLDVDRAHRLPAAERAPVPFARVTDPAAVALTFGRAAGLMFVMGLLWMASGWNSGGTALFGIVALLSMLSAAPNPAAVARWICVGHLLAPVFALGCYSLLPILPTFPLLVLGSLPFLLVILRIGAHPPLAPLGIALNMGFMVALSLGLAPKINPQFYLNDALAIAVGAVLVLASFAVFPNISDRRGQRRRLLRLLRGQVAVAARAPLGSVSARFDSRGHDLLRQITVLVPANTAAARRLDDWMAQVHAAGMAVIGLRQWRAREPGLPPAVGSAIDALIAALVALYARPSRSRRQAVETALDGLAQQLRTAALDAGPVGALLAQLRGSMEHGHRALRGRGEPVRSVYAV